jgi:hypothetical protein
MACKRHMEREAGGASSSSSPQAVHTFCLNPKAVSIGELYGDYSALTTEWRDGLVSSIIRAAITDATPDHKCIPRPPNTSHNHA